MRACRLLIISRSLLAWIPTCGACLSARSMASGELFLRYEFLTIQNSYLAHFQQLWRQLFCFTCSHSVGDFSQAFTMQSGNKCYTYGIAVEEYGAEQVHSHIGMEPSGQSFNSLYLSSSSEAWRNITPNTYLAWSLYSNYSGLFYEPHVLVLQYIFLYETICDTL